MSEDPNPDPTTSDESSTAEWVKATSEPPSPGFYFSEYREEGRNPDRQMLRIISDKDGLATKVRDTADFGAFTKWEVFVSLAPFFYWSVRVAWPRKEGESRDSGEDDWRIIDDWIDEYFGHVQLEWLDGVFVLWAIGSSSQSKILDRFHDEIFERKQAGS